MGLVDSLEVRVLRFRHFIQLDQPFEDLAREQLLLLLFRLLLRGLELWVAGKVLAPSEGNGMLSDLAHSAMRSNRRVRASRLSFCRAASGELSRGERAIRCRCRCALRFFCSRKLIVVELKLYGPWHQPNIQ